MTNNPTIDGVSRELLERLLTDACNENWSELNELLNASAACRCRRFGKDNPHWPCPVHSAHGGQRGPTAVMTEAGCQAYMDADGMIGIMHDSSMGHAYVAMRALDPEFAALQSTIAPPAPVSVVLPDFDTWYAKNVGVVGTEPYRHDRRVWNACLDATAALNAKAAPELFDVAGDADGLAS